MYNSLVQVSRESVEDKRRHPYSRGISSLLKRQHHTISQSKLYIQERRGKSRSTREVMECLMKE